MLFPKVIWPEALVFTIRSSGWISSARFRNPQKVSHLKYPLHFGFDYILVQLALELLLLLVMVAVQEVR